MTLTPRERDALEGTRTGEPLPLESLDDDSWVPFGLRTLLTVAGRIRLLAEPAAITAVKADGSPTTALESQIESEVRQALVDFAPGVSFLGEETGGHLEEEGWTVVLDPIDGTYAYLGHTETFATVMTVFRHGEPRIGFVASPLTGEVGYAVKGGGSRLLRLNLFGEGHQGADLPLAGTEAAPVLVNVHPARGAGPAVDALMEGWREKRIRMVRAPGGSPSWALLGAALGYYTYVNLWDAAEATPWDLAAGLLMVWGAGGEVVDLAGRPIEPVGHRGPFVAGVRAEHRERVRELLRSSGAGRDDDAGSAE